VRSLVDINLVNKVSDELKKQRQTLATAESCTGGLLAHTLTNISGSSNYFDRGVISYSNTSKKDLLDVPEQLLQKYGAVSQQVAEHMAKGIRQKASVDYGIATTGIAGPTGGTKDKPIGLIYIAIATKDSVITKRFLFSGNRLTNKENTVTAVLELLLELLSLKS
jgi:PncC family amidohydrolase